MRYSNPTVGLKTIVQPPDMEVSVRCFHKKEKIFHQSLSYFVFSKGPKKNYVFNKIDHYPEDVNWLSKENNWANKVKTPTRLPEELVSFNLLHYGSNEGDIVLDPFINMQAVPLLYARKILKRNYLGFEIVKDYP